MSSQETNSNSDVTIPIKRTTGETLKERLTSNAYHNIIPARYLHQDADGNYTEEVEDLFPRVAKNVALGEAVHSEHAPEEGIEVTPDQIKPIHHKREELAEELFGEGTELGDDKTIHLNEKNVKYFAYDTVVPEIEDQDLRTHVEEVYEEFEHLMSNLKFIPNSPTLMNAGLELQQLSACFVNSPEDDMEDIHETAKEAAQVFQSGGGQGYAFWKLRPYGDPVAATGGIASGPITFMETFDQMCFPAGTSVKTPNGEREIQELAEGDSVIDKNGEYQTIVDTIERDVSEPLVEISFDRINKSVEVTEEHPYMRVKKNGTKEWVDASELEEGDYVQVNAYSGSNEITRASTFEITNHMTGDLYETENGIKINRDAYKASKGQEPAEINKEIDSETLFGLAGWYAAEGSVEYQRGIPSAVKFTLNSDEQGAAQYIQDALTELGVNSRIDPREKRNTQHVIAENATLAELFENWFGTGSENKRIPRFLREAPVDIQVTFLQSLFDGDGHHQVRGNGSQRQKLKMTSKEVIDFVYDVGIRAGAQFSRHYPSKSEDRKQVYEVNMSISTAVNTPLERLFHDVSEEFSGRDRSKTIDGYEVVKVSDIDTVEYSGKVHNLKVEGTNTYIAEDVVVHNCGTIAQGGKRRGAQMGVMRVSHPDVIEFIHSKNKDVSLAYSLRLNDPDDPTHTRFKDALEEARELIDEDGRVPEHLRNAVEGHLSNFNISVGVTDDFMDAVLNGDYFTFTNPRTEEPHIATEETKEMYERYGLGSYVEVGEPLEIPAVELWDRMVEGAHENGEPGVIYLERVNKKHSFDVEEHPEHRILATNPCGEQPLEEYEACNLGHINLSTVAAEDSPNWVEWYDEDEWDSVDEAVEVFLEDAIDWDEFDYRIREGTRFLENVVTMSDFPVDNISKTVRELRKIGLGIMGLAQLYVQVGVRYGSEPANKMAEELMTHINHGSKQMSHELAQVRGSFEEWDKSKYANPTEYKEWFEHQTGEDAEDWEDGFPIRNHNTTTIAPTGTTSMVGNTTGGCEPMYNVAYYKNVSQDVQGDEMLVEFDDYFLRVLEANDIDVDSVKEEAEEQMSTGNFEGVDGLSTVPDNIGELFVTTSELSGREHASVQCACQEGVDSAISKTVNFPNSATVDEMREVYEYIYKNGGKGVTVYRDGTRNKQVLTTSSESEFAEAGDGEAAEMLVEQIEEVFGDLDSFLEEEEAQSSISKQVTEDMLDDSPYSNKRSRPDKLPAEAYRIQTGYGKIYVHIGEDVATGEPFELFATIGDSGGFTNAFTEALAKTISTALRAGVSPEEIADELRGIRSPKVAWDNGEKVRSIPDAIGLALTRYLDESDSSLNEGEYDEVDERDEEQSQNIADVSDLGGNPECPDCGRMELEMTEGCKTCQNCGWSEC